MLLKRCAITLYALSLVGTLSCSVSTSAITSSTVPATTSATPYSVDDSIVQVWQPAGDNLHAANLLAFGVAVGDGTQILTVLDYESFTPEPLEVISPKYGTFNASVQAIDSRTSATLLKLGNGKIPAANIGEAPTVDTTQQVFVCGWGGIGDSFLKTPARASYYQYMTDLFFNVSLADGVLMSGTGYVSGEGGVVIDGNDNVLGLLSKLGNGLSIILGYPGMMPPVVCINSAMELLLPCAEQSPWMNGPALAFLLSQEGRSQYFPETYPVSDLTIVNDAAASLGKLGAPLSVDDLAGGYSILYFAPGFKDGSLLTLVYPQPVELHDVDGTLLGTAKWVGIQWNRSDGKPDRLIYGDKPYDVKGAFALIDN